MKKLLAISKKLCILMDLVVIVVLLGVSASTVKTYAPEKDAAPVKGSQSQVAEKIRPGFEANLSPRRLRWAQVVVASVNSHKPKTPEPSAPVSTPMLRPKWSWRAWHITVRRLAVLTGDVLLKYSDPERKTLAPQPCVSPTPRCTPSPSEKTAG